MPGIGLGIAKCPYDPQDNSTAIYVESGNPGGLPALVSDDDDDDNNNERHINAIVLRIIVFD